MAENLMNSAHKASNKAFREGWDQIFGGVPKPGRRERSAKPYTTTLVQIQSPPPQSNQGEENTDGH